MVALVTLLALPCASALPVRAYSVNCFLHKLMTSSLNVLNSSCLMIAKWRLQNELYIANHLGSTATLPVLFTPLLPRAASWVHFPPLLLVTTTLFSFQSSILFRRVKKVQARVPRGNTSDGDLSPAQRSALFKQKVVAGTLVYPKIHSKFWNKSLASSSVKNQSIPPSSYFSIRMVNFSFYFSKV